MCCLDQFSAANLRVAHSCIARFDHMPETHMDRRCLRHLLHKIAHDIRPSMLLALDEFLLLLTAAGVDAVVLDTHLTDVERDLTRGTENASIHRAL